MRDPHSRTYNFDPHLEKLMAIQEFDFNSVSNFTTPSQDPVLSEVAKSSNKKYKGSTSSMTGVLKHFHFLLSSWRDINTSMLSKAFPAKFSSFTKLSRAPDSVFLRYKDGAYSIDADKEFDGANVLSLMGRYMERLFTTDKETFMKHKIGNSHNLAQNEAADREAYHYSTLGNIVIRSQLDAYDPRLPGTGMFDLKTRAVVPIRMDTQDYQHGTNYEIRTLRGEYESFEREYYDMIRSTMLKYSLQARMGRMDGIFVAFHNIARIFGFQYISLNEMDLALHGSSDRSIGNQEFLLSLNLLNKAFDKATERYPEQV